MHTTVSTYKRISMLGNVLPDLVLFALLWWLTPLHPACAQPLNSFVGIPPLAYVVESIGGEHVKVSILVPSGQDPHTFELTPKQAVALGRAKIFFTLNLPFERHLVDKINDTHRSLTVVDTTKGLKKRLMTGHHSGHEEHETEILNSHIEHDEEETSQTGEPDPHVWLSPHHLETLANNVTKVLAEADPDHAGYFEKNLAVFLEQIHNIHEKNLEYLKPYKGRTFYVFHPAFAYFADAYGLQEKAVEIEGKSPTPKQISNLIQMAKADNAKIIFAQPQFDKTSAQVIANAIGGSVVPVDPLAKDVLANLKRIAVEIKRALEK